MGCLSRADLLAQYPAPIRSLTETLRDLILETVDGFEEQVNDGWRSISFRDAEGGYVCGLFPYVDRVHLLFEHGNRLDDPDGILQGADRRQVRFVVIEPGRRLAVARLRRLLLAAVHEARTRRSTKRSVTRMVRPNARSTRQAARLVVGLTVSAVMMACSAMSTYAQTTRADSVIHFVETFLSGMVFGGSERPVVRIAELPSRMPSNFEIPTGVRVAGSVEFPSMSFTMLETERPLAALAAIRQVLEAGGWVLRPDPRETHFSPENLPGSITYCRDRLAVGLAADEAEDRVSLFYTTTQEVSPCTLPERDVQRERPDAPIPVLRPPTGARSLGSSRGGGGTDRYSTISLQTRLTVEDLRTHYVEQLRENGAEIGSSAATDEAIVVTFRLSDGDGTRWNGAITFSGGSETDRRHVQILVSR